MDSSVEENLQDEGRESKSAKLSDSEVDEPGYMDPKLWGDLQYHIPLDTIFAKLPLREFFQFRLVCKKWNGLAGDRKFLEASNPKPIQKPYFHLCRRGPDYQLHGLLTYTSWCKQWDYLCLGQHDELYSMVANEGLIYSYEAEDSSVLRVFDVHSRVWYTLPPLEPHVQSHYDEDYRPVVALKVDTSSYPYEFQVIRAGGPNASSPTHTYDSRTNTWSVSELTSITDTPIKATCAQVSDAVYVWSNLDSVYCYKIKEDCWYTLDVAEEDYSFENWLTGVGAWKDKVYHMSQVYFGTYPNRWFEIIMYAWEDQKLEWEECDRMPPHLCAWLTNSPDCEPPVLEILTSYCDEWVLIYSYCCEEGNVNKYVLYNLETRVWEIADIPDGLVQPFMDDEDTATFHEDSHCYHRKKSRYWAIEQRDESSDTDDKQRQAEENQPATLDEWNNFLDRL